MLTCWLSSELKHSTSYSTTKHVTQSSTDPTQGHRRNKVFGEYSSSGSNLIRQNNITGYLFITDLQRVYFDTLWSSPRVLVKLKSSSRWIHVEFSWDPSQALFEFLSNYRRIHVGFSSSSSSARWFLILF